ncbi:hypothetical protein O7632_08240 [Solwaraspora sp. WMMD406]|uniref:hypothetical protein n=1 Tax=Solwaraspora sp. WMMD406 TaxID=3016095 RepID=UPI00241707DD|nr:hypothetical protein [Solwaraspora sp. WMMD406]MDG4764094.1 hypothetical protein [Solwaraspora sp. WMMD406]
MQALASAGGFTTAKMNIDMDGVDLSLEDQEPRPVGQGHQETITVRVPRQNLLTVESLERLLVGEFQGEAK